MSPRPIDQRVVAAARRWLGTPYRHQGSRRGVGADCLGLLRGVWREVVGREPTAVPPYTCDWAEIDPGEPLLAAAARYLVPATGIEVGTVIVFRWSPGAAAKHCAIATAPDRMIHAYAGSGTVEGALPPAWRRRVVALHRFPDPAEED